MRVSGAKSNSIHFVNSLLLFFISIMIPRLLERYRCSIRVVILRSFARATSNLSLTRSNPFFFFSSINTRFQGGGKGKRSHENLDRHSFEFLYLLKYRPRYWFKGKYIFYLFIERDLGKFKNVGGNNGTFVRARWNFYEIFRIKNTSLNNKFFLLIVIRVILWIFPILSNSPF